MENTLLLCQVAKLHQRDVEKEIALRQITNQVKVAKEVRKGLVRTYYQARVSFLKNKVERRKYETISPDEHLILNTNA